MSHEEQKMTQGTLCISKDVNYTYSEPSRCFLTVSIAPFVESIIIHLYKKFSLKK